MRMLAVIAVALSGCAAVPGDYSLDSASQDALVVIETNPADALRPGAGFTLEVARYVPEQGMLSYSFSGGWTNTNEVEATPGQRQFVVARTKVSGEHVISSLTHKGHWTACFNGATHSFPVQRGEVVFVGRVDPNPALVAIATGAPSSSMNGQDHYVLDTPRLPLVPPSQIPGWQDAARDYLRRNFPKVQGRLVAAEPRPATFSTGRSLLGERVCYGYGRKPMEGGSGRAETPVQER
jgi:hypothetical protein